jgi:hypothetical protein
MKDFILKVVLIVMIVVAMQYFIACRSLDKQLTTKVQLTAYEQLTIDDFLYDFDYLMQKMADTFPYFGVAKRRLGVDVRELGREARGVIETYPSSLQGFGNELGLSLEDMPSLDEHVFWSIIRHEFFSHFMGFAHCWPLDFRLYDVFRPSYSDPRSPFYTANSNNYHAFTNPVSQRFYQEQEVLYNSLLENQGAFSRFIFRPKASDEEPTGSRSLVDTEIIEDNRIAYLRVSSFTSFHSTTVSALRRFYSDIQKYEHLIIDIRDNIGGSVDFWRMLIIKPLLPDSNTMNDMPLYAFYRESTFGKSLGEENLKTEAQHSRYVPETDYLLTASEIINDNKLIYINVDDVRDLAYGVRFDTSISNIEERHMQQLGLVNASAVPFDGKVWLLTNSLNISAAALFARHAKETGFATLVGEQTGGAYTTYIGAHFTLPNTGIIVRWDIDYLTDSHGRALEEFPTTPHYFNRPGMDALDTVLLLIQEDSL